MEKSPESTKSEEIINFGFLIKNLGKTILSSQKNIKKPTSKTLLISLKKKLSKAILQLDIEQMIEIFMELDELEINTDLLDSTKIMKLIHYFAKSYKDFEDTAVRSMAKTAKYIYFKWKQNISSENLQTLDINKERIRDPKLREKVCNRVIEILNANGFESKESENLAISIENNIRKRDPSMKELYHKFIRKMLKDIKLLDKITYLRTGQMNSLEM